MFTLIGLIWADKIGSHGPAYKILNDLMNIPDLYVTRTSGKPQTFCCAPCKLTFNIFAKQT